MSATPLDITITPDLSVIRWFGRNQDPTVFTITNNDTRDINTCELYCVRGDFLPKGSGRGDEKTFAKKGIGEDLITQGWLEARLVGDPSWTALTDTTPLTIGALLTTESADFEIRLVVPDEVTNEGKTNFALMVAASEAIPEPEPAPTVGMVAWYDASDLSTMTFIPSMDVTVSHCGWTQGCTPTYQKIHSNLVGTSELTSQSYSGASWDTFKYEITGGTGLIKCRYYGKITPSDPHTWNETAWGTSLQFEMYQGTTVILMYAVDESSGGYVSNWADKSGNDYHAYQATVSLQPRIMSATLNDLDILTFADDYMTAPLAVTPATTTPMTIYGVWLTSGTSDALCGAGASAQLRAIRVYQTAATNLSFALYDTTGSRNANLTDAPINTVNMTVVRHDGNLGGYIQNNEGTPAYGTWIGAKNTTASLFWIGAINGGANPLDGYIAELIVYHTAHTPAEIAETTNYLKLKWGL